MLPLHPEICILRAASTLSPRTDVPGLHSCQRAKRTAIAGSTSLPVQHPRMRFVHGFPGITVMIFPVSELIIWQSCTGCRGTFLRATIVTSEMSIDRNYNCMKDSEPTSIGRRGWNRYIGGTMRKLRSASHALPIGSFFRRALWLPLLDVPGNPASLTSIP